MLRGPSPNFDSFESNNDFCMEDYKWFAIVGCVLLIVLGVCILIWG